MKPGYADLHCHPMVHHAFGGAKNGRSLFWGDPLERLPEALPSCTRAHLLNLGRGPLSWLTAEGAEWEVRTGGFDMFPTWPNPATRIHQQMHIDQVKRAWQGGLRLMVASAVNNELLGDYYHGKQDGDPDAGAIDTQLDAIKSMVAKCPWMRLVDSACAARKALDDGKLGVILGIEVDSIAGPDMRWEGQLSNGAATRIVKNWLSKGVRLINPIHVADNALGGAAVYNDMFNCLNHYLIRKHARKPDRSWFFEVDDASKDPRTEDIRFILSRFGSVLTFAYGTIFGYPSYSRTVGTSGHVNRRGLSPAGREFITAMMSEGMLIDVEHMSTRCLDDTLVIAEKFDYPIVSSHTGLRSQAIRIKGAPFSEGFAHEAMRSDDDLKRIKRLGGILGLGAHLGATRQVRLDESTSWAKCFLHAVGELRFESVAIGTDMNGFARAPGPRFKCTYLTHRTELRPNRDQARPIEYGVDSTPFLSRLDRSLLGKRPYDLNFDGFAHYGLLPDFALDVALSVGNGNAPDWKATEPFLYSAEGVIKAWCKCEAQKGAVPRC